VDDLSFGLAAQSSWPGVFLGFAALTMAWAYPDRRSDGSERAVVSWVSLAPLAMLAAGSSLVAVMYPEALAGGFGQI
jgi:hypothetical protein